MRAFSLCIILGMLLAAFTGCGQTAYSMAYQPDAEVSGFNVIDRNNASTASTFAERLCIITRDVTEGTDIDMGTTGAAVLFDVNNCAVLYSKDAHTQLHPASLTKIMTALVALKYGSYDQTLTATDAVIITEQGAQLAGIQPGDSMTLNQALHVLLMYSANDVAMLIAENVGGTVDHFIELMNEEAKALGATNTHFVNPHGLTDEDHYTTAYDLYLIFNEAIKNEKISEIIQMNSYETTYHNAAGDTKTLSLRTTNRYLQGSASSPENITVIGGKTGTTKAAGSCLILLARDSGGAPYIAVILKAESADVLYEKMSELLEEIQK